ncbi:MAG TPA: hypothetical protein VIX73_18655 [Kofleriaceae bacterium]|jgi:hypothetical protein
MIKLSVRAIAQYLVSDPATRLQLLRDRKFIAPESIARARFYSEARTSITAYHRGALSRDMIEARVVSMRREARYANPSQSCELMHNADVLERYLYYQGHRELELAPPPTADLVRSDVVIAVRPSLFAIEHGERRLIFLELREAPRRAAMRIDPTGGAAPRPAGRAVGVPTPRDSLSLIAELAFEAFRPVLWNLAPRSVQVVDVRRGIVNELQAAGSAIGRDLAEACKTISQLWPQLGPRPGTQPEPRPTERQMAIAWDVES